jgi:hypothetical protein
MTNTTEGLLRSLLDKQAITEVLYRYCRACDRADEAALRECFHPGSVHRHGGFSGTSADFITFAMKIISASKMTKHLLTNVLIELDVDVATSESHYFAYHRLAGKPPDAEVDNFSGGRYLDRFERRQGVWKMVERLGLLDFERFDPATDRNFYEKPRAQLSRAYPEDPLFTHFALGAHPAVAR